MSRGQDHKRPKSAVLLLLGKKIMKDIQSRTQRGSGLPDKPGAERERGCQEACSITRQIGDKCQPQVVDDAIYHSIAGEEGYEAHLSAALRAEERVDFINLADHLSPAFSWEGPELRLNNREREDVQARFIEINSSKLTRE